MLDRSDRSRYALVMGRSRREHRAAVADIEVVEPSELADAFADLGRRAADAAASYPGAGR